MITLTCAEFSQPENIFEVHLLQSLRVALIYIQTNKQYIAMNMSLALFCGVTVTYLVYPCRIACQVCRAYHYQVCWPRKIKVFGFITTRSTVVVELCVGRVVYMFSD